MAPSFAYLGYPENKYLKDTQKSWSCPLCFPVCDNFQHQGSGRVAFCGKLSTSVLLRVRGTHVTAKNVFCAIVKVDSCAIVQMDVFFSSKTNQHPPMPACLELKKYCHGIVVFPLLHWMLDDFPRTLDFVFVQPIWVDQRKLVRVSQRWGTSCSALNAVVFKSPNVSKCASIFWTWGMKCTGGQKVRQRIIW